MRARDGIKTPTERQRNESHNRVNRQSRGRNGRKRRTQRDRGEIYKRAVAEMVDAFVEGAEVTEEEVLDREL